MYRWYTHRHCEWFRNRTRAGRNCCQLKFFLLFTKDRTKKQNYTYLANDKYSFFGPQPAALSALLGYAPKPAIVHTKQNNEKELHKLTKIVELSYSVPHSLSVIPM